jgi:hypothetical protein
MGMIFVNADVLRTVLGFLEPVTVAAAVLSCSPEVASLARLSAPGFSKLALLRKRAARDHARTAYFELCLNQAKESRNQLNDRARGLARGLRTVTAERDEALVDYETAVADLEDTETHRDLVARELEETQRAFDVTVAHFADAEAQRAAATAKRDAALTERVADELAFAEHVSRADRPCDVPSRCQLMGRNRSLQCRLRSTRDERDHLTALNGRLSESIGAALTERATALTERDAAVGERDTALGERDAALARFR